MYIQLVALQSCFEQPSWIFLNFLEDLFQLVFEKPEMIQNCVVPKWSSVIDQWWV